MKASTSISLKVLSLTAVMFICFAVAGAAIRTQGLSQTPEEAQRAGLALLAVCLLDTLVLSHIILRSRWGGWRLIVTVFVVFFGVMTFMSQIESAVFVHRLPSGTLPRLFLMGFLVAAPFSVLAVPILGKRRAGVDHDERSGMSAGEWAWKIAVLALAYAVVYFTFGYFVAWRNPAVREYYGGVDHGSFFAHMASVVRDTFWLIPFQILRGTFWVLIAVPVIRMMKGSWQETALALGLLFAVLMNALLLIPNPYMPAPVRMTHLVETASSNFLFGLLVGWVLARPAAPRPSHL